MSDHARAMEEDLCAHLNEIAEFTERGFTAETGSAGGVVIARGNHVYGLWRFDDGFRYISPASREPIGFAASVATAVRITFELIRSGLR